ncbi:hypothetical protein GCM10008932_24690 [Alkalibacterium iburiense]|uniref:Uncharacterized protein n=1 Tax=Alkalibacterium iburiense TaxID=290589 RepID=A0ABN0XTZ4_9LACT
MANGLTSSYECQKNGGMIGNPVSLSLELFICNGMIGKGDFALKLEHKNDSNEGELHLFVK